ncbi:hypothetical protein R2TS_33990 [Enterobacter asburiae]|nr:hypothetical protein R2TS_33990 [Enterobacter asburiae]
MCRTQVALDNSRETFSSVDVAEKLFKITVLLKRQTGYLADRYSEQKESHQELLSPLNHDNI